MSFFIRHWLVLLILIVLYMLVAAGTAAFEAWMDVRSRKQVPMYWCSGCKSFFKKEYALQLFPELKGTAENSFACPTCYYRAVFKDPNARLNQ